MKSSFRKIDNPAAPDKTAVRTAVIDPDDHGFAIVQVSHPDTLLKWHIPHGTGHIAVIKDFIIRGVKVDAWGLFRIP